jgi:hypothetical protein
MSAVRKIIRKTAVFTALVQSGRMLRNFLTQISSIPRGISDFGRYSGLPKSLCSPPEQRVHWVSCCPRKAHYWKIQSEYKANQRAQAARDNKPIATEGALTRKLYQSLLLASPMKQKPSTITYGPLSSSHFHLVL